MGKGVSHVGDAFVARLQGEKQKRMTGGRKGAELSDVAGMLAGACLGWQAAAADNVCLSKPDCLSFRRCACECGFRNTFAFCVAHWPSGCVEISTTDHFVLPTFCPVLRGNGCPG